MSTVQHTAATAATAPALLILGAWLGQAVGPAWDHRGLGWAGQSQLLPAADKDSGVTSECAQAQSLSQLHTRNVGPGLDMTSLSLAW